MTLLRHDILLPYATAVAKNDCVYFFLLVRTHQVKDKAKTDKRRLSVSDIHSYSSYEISSQVTLTPITGDH